MLPFERHVRWAQARALPGKVAENLMGGAGTLAAALIGRKSKLPGPVGLLLNLVGPDLVTEAAKLAGENSGSSTPKCWPNRNTSPRR